MGGKLKSEYPYILAGRRITDGPRLAITNKFTGERASQVAQADGRAINKAIEAAEAAREECGRMPAHERAKVLRQIASGLSSRQEEFARILAIEAGKPIRDGRVEVARAVDTFSLAGEEAGRIRGEYLPLDGTARGAGYEAVSKRVPVGVCSFITPFNFPMNLVAHKVAPAIAVGCPWVLKPASKTPISAILLGEIIAETAWPKGAFSVLPCTRDGADLFTTDERIKLLSFTGSPEVGWGLKAKAGKKKVVLELGGNAACIVDRDADVKHAVERLVVGAFYQSGQSCISVQRVFVHADRYEEVVNGFTAAASKLKSGDPLSEETFLGPIISEDDAVRLEKWIGESVSRGARLLCGGDRRGVMLDATILEGVPDDLPLSCAEAFGPVAIVERFTDFASACRRVNESRYGLQAGVFTKNMDRALYAWNHLEVGGVIINDVPSFRADAMPYGGVKDSGLGREGLRYAMEDMTEIRLMVLAKMGQLA